jgi:Xaa-Pro aminopeptidase
MTDSRCDTLPHGIEMFISSSNDPHHLRNGLQQPAMNSSLAAQRRQRLWQACEAAGIRTLIVYGNAWTCDYLRYACDFAPLEGHALAILDSNSTRLLLEVRSEASSASAKTHGLEVKWASDFYAEAQSAITAAGAGLGHAPAAHLPSGLTPTFATSIDFTAAFQNLLMVKLEGEIAAVRRAAMLADEGYEVFRHAAREGRAEFEIVGELEEFFRSRGCPDNFMIMASGGQEVRAMHPPSARRLRRGDLVTTELTPCLDGYYAQICRTLVVGAASAEQQQAFDVHLEALEAGMAFVRPGVTAGEVAMVQNDIFRAHGLAKYITSEYTRVRGHGLGLYVDSRPAVLEGEPTRLEASMTIIVHPNGYHPASGYMVLGDAVVLRDGGNEVLTQTPRRLFTV